MRIPRNELMQHLKEFALNRNGLVVGFPGIGKSYSLLALMHQLNTKNIPCLILPIDKLNAESDDELSVELGLKENFISYLHSKSSPTTKCIIIFDAFDAARSSPSQTYFFSLIKRLINKMGKNWNVIVSSRIYDAKKSITLQELFPSQKEEKLNLNYQHKDIHCRHFYINELSDIEVQIAVESITDAPRLFEDLNNNLKILLKNPFNLWLIEKIVQNNQNRSELGNISSEIQLLDLFWAYRIKNGSLSDSREILLTKICRRMIDQHSLNVRKEDVFDNSVNEVWIDLLSKQILEESQNSQRILFSHNILFDYAVSVLILEDSADLLVRFILQDRSRMILLRPSFDYFFTRLFITNPNRFWNIFWGIIYHPSASNVRIFRLIPITIIAKKATTIEILFPLIEKVGTDEVLSNSVIVDFFQVINTLEIQSDDLWLGFLELLSQKLNKQISWQFAIMLKTIIDRSKFPEENGRIQLIGKISRNFFTWIWISRSGKDKFFFDKLGSNLGAYLIVNTYETNIPESRKIIEKILELPKTEKDFPLEYYIQISFNIEKIFICDPEFGKTIYITFFEYPEMSTEVTHFGTPVLPFRSTRKQDYGACTYSLIQKISKFLDAFPVPATETIIICVNTWQLSQLDKKIKSNFSFRGGEATYIKDYSNFWDENPHFDEEIELADKLFEYIQRFDNDIEHLKIFNDLLDVFRDKVLIAFFWRRLLVTASSNPKFFYNYIFELCISKPILTNNETHYVVSDFIENAISIFDKNQILAIEKAVANLGIKDVRNDNEIKLQEIKNRLIARIPGEVLQTLEGKKLKKIQETESMVSSKYSVNVETPVQTKILSPEEILKLMGVDLSKEEHQPFIQYFNQINSFISEWQNKTPSKEAISKILPELNDLFNIIQGSKITDAPLIKVSWTKFSEGVACVSKGIDNPEREGYAFCKNALIICSKHQYPEYNPEYDDHFDSPAWSPAPRNSAAEGLCWFAALTKDPEIISRIEELCFDKVPSVRYLAISRLFKISVADPEDFWRIIKRVAENEWFPIIQDSICLNIRNFVKDDITNSKQVLETLFLKCNTQKEFPRRLISLIVAITFVFDDSWGQEKLNIFLKNPIEYSEALKNSTFEVVQLIKPGYLGSEKNIKAVERSLGWLKIAITSSIQAISKNPEFLNPKSDGLPKLQNLYSVVDEIITRIYFSADIPDMARNKQSKITDESRDKYFKTIKPLIIHLLNECEHYSLSINPRTAYYFVQLMNGLLNYDPKTILEMTSRMVKLSENTGYNFDPLGKDEIVKLCENVFSNYRFILLEEAAMNDMLYLLDTFVVAGWQEPLRLIWKLDEIYR
jgi:hypothetical protein